MVKIGMEATVASPLAAALSSELPQSFEIAWWLIQPLLAWGLIGAVVACFEMSRCNFDWRFLEQFKPDRKAAAREAAVTNCAKQLAAIEGLYGELISIQETLKASKQQWINAGRAELASLQHKVKTARSHPL